MERAAGKDIVKKSSVRKGRYLLVLNFQLAPAAAGKLVRSWRWCGGGGWLGRGGAVECMAARAACSAARQHSCGWAACGRRGWRPTLHHTPACHRPFPPAPNHRALASPVHTPAAQGTLAALDSQNPVLYLDFPQGRYKLLGALLCAEVGVGAPPTTLGACLMWRRLGAPAARAPEHCAVPLSSPFTDALACVGPPRPQARWCFHATSMWCCAWGSARCCVKMCWRAW